MRLPQIKIIILLVVPLLYSCRPISNQDNSTVSRDTLLSNFLKMVDTLPYYDTTNLNFKLLKFYQENDTSNLKKIVGSIHNRSTIPWMHAYLKPCAINTEFDTLTADESYKFSYESSFCQYYTIATITQRGSSVKAVATVYLNVSNMDSIPCKIVQQYETDVDSTYWVKFRDAIFVSDFWGLKEDNDYHGTDGSSLDVQGFKKGYTYNRNINSKRSYVSRWSRSMDNLLDPFLMLLRICKIKNGCIFPGSP